MMPQRVLVLDGHANLALTCVRSLGRAGHTWEGCGIRLGCSERDVLIRAFDNWVEAWREVTAHLTKAVGRLLSIRRAEPQA